MAPKIVPNPCPADDTLHGAKWRLLAFTDQGDKMHSFGTLRGVKLGHHMAPMQHLKWHLRRHPRMVARRHAWDVFAVGAWNKQTDTQTEGSLHRLTPPYTFADRREHRNLKTSAPSNLRREHPRTRAFSYACSLPVTWQDGGHTIESAIVEKPRLHARKLRGCMFYRTGVIADGSFTFEIGIFDVFGNCDLDLEPVTFKYELNTYPLETYRMCENERPTLGLSKVIVCRAANACI